MFKQTIGCELKTKHIYICHVGTYIGAYDPYTGEVVGYDTSDKFMPFVTDILQKYPEYSPHNIINDGVADKIREKIEEDKENKKKIDFIKKVCIINDGKLL